MPLKLKNSFALVSKDEEERSYAIEKLIESYHASGIESVRLFPPEDSSVTYDHALFDILQPSLFSLDDPKAHLYIVYEANRLSASQELIQAIKDKGEDCIILFVFAIADKTYKTMNEAGVFTATQELNKKSIWEKKKEQFKDVSFLAEKKGLRFDQAALALVKAMAEDHPLFMAQEIDKLALFLKASKQDPKVVTKEHITSISSFVEDENLWQIAENLLLGKGALEEYDAISDKSLLQLLPILRYLTIECFKYRQGIHSAKIARLDKRFKTLKSLPDSYFLSVFTLALEMSIDLKKGKANFEKIHHQLLVSITLLKQS